MAKRTKGLKAALQQHLHKQLAKGRVEKPRHHVDHARKHAEKHARKPKAYIPFGPLETLLLIGEGDFSFACSLIRSDYILPDNLIASSLDSEEEIVRKYPNGRLNLDFLSQQGVRVLHGVDCTQLEKTVKDSFQNVMFNFPHTGRGMKDVDRNVRDHQILVKGYFDSANKLLQYAKAEPKRVILTLFEGEPYVLWEVKLLARSVGLKVVRSGRFDWDAFNGYHHKRTNSNADTTKPALEREARIYEFEPVKLETP